MDPRRNKPKLLCKRRESTDLFNDVSSASTHTTTTPVRLRDPSEDEDSPYFPCSTQEMNDDVDVLWDYNSPQSKPKTSITKKSRKRLNLQQSPKVSFRRYPSNNNEQIKQDFNKLREELRALKAEIAKPDHEDSLVLSPREEEAYKRVENDVHLDNMHDFDHNIMEELPLEVYGDCQDPFDDDMDEKLILFSQCIEKSIYKPDNVLDIRHFNNVGSKKVFSNSNLNANQQWSKNQPSVPKILVNNCDKSDIRSTTAKTEYIRPTTAKSEYLGQTRANYDPYVMHQKQMEMKLPLQSFFPTDVKTGQVISLQDSAVFNDSFDNVLSQMDDEDLDQLTQVVDIKRYTNGKKNSNIDKKCKAFPRSLSEDSVITESVQMASGKVEWHRTQSFESYNAQLSKEKLEEIERKRLEAKAKRDAKKKNEAVPTVTEVSDSPIKCSPDEIEKKRLQALEKLEAKRLQDIIEKKKQEALKRREENRKKKAANVKSSLSTRL